MLETINPVAGLSGCPEKGHDLPRFVNRGEAYQVVAQLATAHMELGTPPAIANWPLGT